MRKGISLLLSLTLTVGLASMGLASTPGVLTIWADDTRAPVFEALGEEYTAATGIPVEVFEIPFDDIRGELATAGPVGEGPDIIIGAHDWVGELAADGHLMELELPAGLAEEFDPATLEAFSQVGPLYGIPYAREGIALVYNKGLIEEAPETWDELVAFAREFTNPGVPQYGFVVQNPDPYHSFPFISALGGYIFGFDEDGVMDPCDVGLDNEGAITGVEYMVELFEEGLLPAGIGYDEWLGLFEEGRIAMAITGPWAVPSMQAAGQEVGVAPIPLIEGQRPLPLMGVQGVMVSAYTENPALVEDFLFEYFVTQDAMLAMYEQDPRPPAYFPAADAIVDDPILEGFIAATEGATPMPGIPEMAAVWGAWTDAMELIGLGELSAEEGLTQAADDIRDTLDCE